MEITNIIAQLRLDPLLQGDYNAYRAACTRKIEKLQKRLGRTSSKSKKYTPKAPLTPEDVANDARAAYLLIYSSERAWAYAMLMKSLSADAGKQNATGTTRRHIITRFQKAHRYAAQVVKLLQDPASNGSRNSVLEARAYAASLAGAVSLEKRQWQSALTQFSTSRVIYSALVTNTKSDIFKELLAGSIDPSVRYSAYQNQLSRSLDVPTISRQHFLKSDEKLVASVKELDPTSLKEEEDATTSDEGVAVVNSVTWRSRTAPVQDADVASALGNVQTAEKALQSYLESHKAATGRDQAGEFDEILAAWQESVDVTKKAIDDMVTEGVNSGDEKLQALQLTYTYVNYNLISWRIRRNRVMAKGLVNARIGKTSKLGALKEELALWDAILQSLDQVTELPGVAADDDFIKEIEGRRLYFLALKCSAIAQSHILLSNRLNALALYNQALTYIESSVSHLPSSSASDSNNSIEISTSEAKSLQDSLQADVTRYHALVEMDRLTAAKKKSADKRSTKPLIQTLNQYPEQGVNFENLVTYPPQVEPVPVKPVFLDIAWNFIEYPGKEVVYEQKTAATSTDAGGQTTTQQQQRPEIGQKKSLFGGFWGR